MRRIGIGLVWAVAGYVIGAIGGGLLVGLLSGNRFDREMEATMTGAFVTGPLAAVVALVTGIWRTGRRRAGPPPGTG